MKKVLVTGGGGFIGQHIVERLLARGLEVSTLGRSPQPGLKDKGVKTIQADLVEPTQVVSACKDMDAIFHVAAKAGVWGRRKDYHSANVIGTRNILQACREQHVPYLIHTSTPSVVFNGKSFAGEDESLPYGSNWLCHYAETKAIAEKEVLEANGKNGLATTALRPHLVWGKGDPHLLPRVIQRARLGKLRIVGDGTNLVDISHVQNVADAHLLALDALMANRANGKAYFLSQGKPVVLWEWLNSVLARLHIPQISRKISVSKAYAIGSILEKLWTLLPLPGEPPMTRFVAVELGKSHYFDIGAARRDLEYEPVLNTEQGVEGFLKD
jgi:nucleoside-diphosphate-sugar epimerase